MSFRYILSGRSLLAVTHLAILGGALTSNILVRVMATGTLVHPWLSDGGALTSNVLFKSWPVPMAWRQLSFLKGKFNWYELGE